MHRLLFFIHLLFQTFLYAQFSDSDIKAAALYFNEAKQIAITDKTRLWGTDMYGSIIFIDPKTKDAIANEQDSAGIFKMIHGVYVGKIPASFSAANTAQKWGGKIWVVLQWPLPHDKYERANLVMHESYHRLQKLKSLPATDANCVHLDKLMGDFC